jgi:hypothetical protein
MKKIYPIEPHEAIHPVTHAMHHSTGLTKREHFASILMASFLTTSYKGTANDFAKAAINAADALIEELNKTQDDKGTTV